MIMFKTEMKEKPRWCNACTQKEICKITEPCNLNVFLCKRPFNCPLIEAEDTQPKPKATITQHEHDLLSILSKVYLGYKYLVIFKNMNLLHVSEVINDFDSLGSGEYLEINLFRKEKLPTLLCEFTDKNFKALAFDIEEVLSRPIKD